MRVVFAGTPEPAVPSLRRLLESGGGGGGGGVRPLFRCGGGPPLPPPHISPLPPGGARWRLPRPRPG
ncbi:hypothetical protein [Nocardia gipuzkoensis]|uniref:hypothetical protein n=1 Tax=Nocardia gipuzkoensis TaxID=2749991 RepID=UPI0024544AC5|nr:hypothetical protein [Nocardia gipuzkoensis]